MKKSLQRDISCLLITPFEIHDSGCFMKKALTLLLTLAAVAVASAQTQYTISLDAAQDGGGARTGSGSGTLTLNGNILTFDGAGIPWSGLSANSTAAHIHGPSGPFPATGSVRYDLVALGNTVVGGTSGTISGSVTLTDPPPSGGAYSLASQLADLNNSLWYINVHSSAFPGGEIRGVIVPVPEPSTLALLGLGAATLVWRLRRKN